MLIMAVEKTARVSASSPADFYHLADEPWLRHVQDISLIYSKDKRILEEQRRSELLDLLRAFVEPNENPNLSSNFCSPGADPVRTFIDILLQRSVQNDAEAVHLLLRCV
jgi:hypothetical protein